jgi:hypothetical protein
VTYGIVLPGANSIAVAFGGVVQSAQAIEIAVGDAVTFTTDDNGQAVNVSQATAAEVNFMTAHPTTGSLVNTK